MAAVVPLRRPGPRLQRHLRGRGTRIQGAVLLFLLALVFLCHEHHGKHGEPLPEAFIASDFTKQVLPFVVAIVLGFTLYALKGKSLALETAAIVLVYFGAQTGMNVYMKNVLSNIVVDEGENLKGIPIGFLLTSIQQFVAFTLFCCFLLVGRLFGAGYQVKKLSTQREYVAVLCFSVTFALNIGLNNFSISLIAISVNLIIRSCLPLVTAVSQVSVGSFLGVSKKTITGAEWLLMLLGVSCAALATWAKSASAAGTEESVGLVLGVTVAVLSIFSGGMNMVLAGALGSELKFNPIDTTCYMSLPAGLMLLLPTLMVSHPMATWPGFSSMTDWEVLGEVLKRSPLALTPVVFSGVLALMYNILQYTLVHKLSAAYAAFAGNFNKAATVALSLLMGMEHLPHGGYGLLFLAAVVGNIVAFTIYSSLKVKK